MPLLIIATLDGEANFLLGRAGARIWVLLHSIQQQVYVFLKETIFSVFGCVQPLCLYTFSMFYTPRKQY